MTKNEAMILLIQTYEEFVGSVEAPRMNGALESFLTRLDSQGVFQSEETTDPKDKFMSLLSGFMGDMTTGDYGHAEDWFLDVFGQEYHSPETAAIMYIKKYW